MLLDCLSCTVSLITNKVCGIFTNTDNKLAIIQSEVKAQYTTHNEPLLQTSLIVVCFRIQFNILLTP